MFPFWDDRLFWDPFSFSIGQFIIQTLRKVVRHHIDWVLGKALQTKRYLCLFVCHNLSFCLSAFLHLSISLSFCLSDYFALSFCLIFSTPIFLIRCPSLCLFFCLGVSPSLCLLVHLSFYLVFLSIFLSVCAFLCITAYYIPFS
jgi:hypothetical protein